MAKKQIYRLPYPGSANPPVHADLTLQGSYDEIEVNELGISGFTDGTDTYEIYRPRFARDEPLNFTSHHVVMPDGATFAANTGQGARQCRVDFNNNAGSDIMHTWTRVDDVYAVGGLIVVVMGDILYCYDAITVTFVYTEPTP